MREQMGWRLRLATASFLLCAIPLLLPAAQNDANAETRALLERAQKALHGPAKPGEFRGISSKGKGKFTQGNIAIVFEGEAFVQDSDRFRHDLLLGENQGTNLTLVVTGSKSWVKVGTGKPTELPEQLAPFRATFYAVSLSQQPHALGNKPFRLAAIGEVEVAGRPVLGLRVSKNDWPDVNVFYDKESCLPVKCEVRVKDPATAQEVNDEFFLSEYKAFQGHRHYTKVVGKRDGNVYIERELTEVRFVEQLADNLFTMP